MGSADQIQLNYFLGRLSDHLDKLAGQVFNLEHTLGSIAPQAGSADVAVIRNLQGLDFMRQSLEDTAMLTLLISKCEIPDNMQIDNPGKIAAKLKLNTTQMLLNTGKTVVTTNSPGNLGDVELF